MAGLIASRRPGTAGIRDRAGCWLEWLAWLPGQTIVYLNTGTWGCREIADRMGKTAIGNGEPGMKRRCLRLRLSLIMGERIIQLF